MVSQIEAPMRSNSQLAVLVTGLVLVIGIAGALFVNYVLPSDPVADMASACKRAGWSYYDDQTSGYLPRCMDEQGNFHFVPSR
ncbi:MAG TPA: hypothetical protein VJA87_01395 [Candidatus Paceibacterota bacterium]